MSNISDVSSAESTATPATNDARGLAGWMIGGGLLGLIPPVTPLGVGLIIIGGVILAFSPVAAQAEANMIETTTEQATNGSGDGCGAFLWACFVVIAIVLIGGALAVAAATGINQ